MMLVQDLMLILNPWGFDVSELSPQTRASLHLSALLCSSRREPFTLADCLALMTAYTFVNQPECSSARCADDVLLSLGGCAPACIAVSQAL